MKNAGLKTVFLRGLALAIPLAIIGYVLLRIFAGIKRVIGPLAEKTGIHKLLGGLTLTILALILVILVVFLLGLLMQLSAVAVIRNRMDDLLIKFIPSLNYIKLMTAATLDLENLQNQWQPVIVFFEQKYNAAFIVEENGELITLFVSKGTSLREGEIVTANKKELHTVPVSYKELHQCSKAYGKGYISLIQT